MTVQLTRSAMRNGQSVLRATGELDLTQAALLARAIDALAEAGARRLVLDLTGLDFLDSTGVDAIITRLRALRLAGGDLVVAASDERVVRPFTASGADQVLAIAPTVAEARAAVRTEVVALASRRGRDEARTVGRPQRRKAS